MNKSVLISVTITKEIRMAEIKKLEAKCADPDKEIEGYMKESGLVE